MNGVLVLANVIGFIALAVAMLKILETGPTIGPAFSPAARVVLLGMVFLALFAIIEAMAWRGTQRPAASSLILVMGLFALWRAFAPAWSGFLERLTPWHRPPPAAPGPV